MTVASARTAKAASVKGLITLTVTTGKDGLVHVDGRAYKRRQWRGNSSIVTVTTALDRGALATMSRMLEQTRRIYHLLRSRESGGGGEAARTHSNQMQTPSHPEALIYVLQGVYRVRLQ
jgi:hypothetical protein